MMLVTKKLLTEHRKTYLYLIAGYLGFCLLVGIWVGYIGGAPGSTCLFIYSFFAGLVSTIIASMTFFELRNKEGRISCLMTPASAADKFIPRLLGVGPGMIILLTAGYFVLSFGIILSNGLLYWYPAATMIPGIREIGKETILFVTGSYCVNVSFFILGSVLWPKKSFFKTLLALIILQMALSTILFGIFKMINPMMYDVEITDTDSFMWGSFAFSLLLSAALLYTAYLRFKRFTVIS